MSLPRWNIPILALAFAAAGAFAVMGIRGRPEPAPAGEIGGKSAAADSAHITLPLRAAAPLADKASPFSHSDAGENFRKKWARNPLAAVTEGEPLLVQYVNSGDFESALVLIDAAPAKDLRSSWITVTFARWGARDAHAARHALARLVESDRLVAFHALAEGWASIRPAELAACADALPDGEERQIAISAATRNLSLQDPATLSAWIAHRSPDSSLDAATAALVLQADAANRSPEIALQWAERITDHTLRAKARAHALLEIADTDTEAAEKRLAAFAPAEREEILHQLAAHPANGDFGLNARPDTGF